MHQLPQKASTLYQGQWLTLKQRGTYEFVTRESCTGVVMVIAFTEQDEIVLVEQLRPAVQSQVLEFPAGLVGDKSEFKNEEEWIAAKRELLEETGYEAGQMTLLSKGAVCPGSMDQIISIYKATELVKRHEGGGDESEDIKVHLVPLTYLGRFIKQYQNSSGLVDARVIFASHFFNLNRLI